MDINKFKGLFHESWWIKFKPFLESSEFEKLWTNLKERSSRGKVIYPYSTLLKKKDPTIENCIFRAFKETSLDDLKVIIINNSPYYDIKYNKVVADGLAFSSRVDDEPLLLEILYNTIEEDVYNGSGIVMKRNPNLSFLAEQGVLLLNASLTNEYNMPDIHFELWKPFMTYLFKNIINNGQSGLHIVFLGDNLKYYSDLIQKGDENTLPFDDFHYVYNEKHVSNYRNSMIMETDLFSTINKRLLNSNKNYIYWDEKEFIDSIPF